MWCSSCFSKERTGFNLDSRFSKKSKNLHLTAGFLREPSDSLKIFRRTQNTELFYSESFYKPRTAGSLILKTLNLNPKPRTEGSLILKISKRPESKVITTAKKLPTPVYIVLDKDVLDEDYHFVKLNYWVQLSFAQALKWVCSLEFRVSKQIVFNLYPISSTPVSTNYQCDKEQWTRTYQRPMQDGCV
jgi:hypothetical protein